MTTINFKNYFPPYIPGDIAQIDNKLANELINMNVATEVVSISEVRDNNVNNKSRKSKNKTTDIK